jgi:hypothetical protein
MGLERESPTGPATTPDDRQGGLSRTTRAVAARPPAAPIRRAPLVVGASDDLAERAAGRVADRVIAALAGGADGLGPRIRRASHGGAAQRSVVGPDGGTVDDELAGRIRRASHGGAPLDPSTRGTMEVALGADLGRVRLHDGAESASLNQALGARAFTFGSDIHLGARLATASVADDTRVLAHELAHVVQATGPIRRLLDRNALVAKAGAPKSVGPLIKRSTEYRKILDLLDRYHVTSRQPWQANTAPAALRAALEPMLEQITVACWAYINAEPDSNRVPHIRDVITTEIPQERARLTAVGSGAPVDRSKPLAQVGVGSPARVTAMGVEIGTTQVPDPQEGGIAECHQMNIWFDIDAGATPAAPVGTPGNSIHGVTVEYWEQVELAYNFVEADAAQVNALKARGEGATSKPWNDVMMLQLDSPTWNKVGGSIQQSWTAAVAAAAVTGGFTGVKRVGFQDNPGVTPKPGKYIHRTLRFRIVVKDAHRKQEILATQVMVGDGGKQLKSMTYVDSRGNKLGRSRMPRGAQLRGMQADDPRLQAHDVTSNVLAASIPALVRAEVRTFVRQLLQGGAAAFQNRELDAMRQAFANPEGPHKAYGRMGQKKHGTVDDYYEIAGVNCVPYPQPGWTYLQYPVQAGGLFVAITEGAQIRRMYYTTGAARPVGARQVQVRSFAEIPIEEVQAYVPSERAYLAMSVPERAEHDQAVQSETGAANARAAAATGPIAAALALGVPDTLRYLRAHLAEYDEIEKEFDRVRAPATLAGALKAAFAAKITVGGTVPATYVDLSRKYPHEKALAILREAWLDALITAGAANRTVADTTFTTMVSNTRAQLGATAALVQLAQNNHGNVAQFKQLVVAFLQQNKGKYPDAESDYNTAIPPLNLGVPATLGEIVNEHFVTELRRLGAGLPAFVQLRDAYPAFEFRLRPAYRFLFGDAALIKVEERLRTAKAAAEVPDPGSAANMAAKQAFRDHGVYSQVDFASSIAPTAKFDVTYDPATAELKVVVKLSFNFLDSTQQLAGRVKGREVSPQYQQTAWTNAAKADWKNEFRRQVLAMWNPSSPTIRCTRPGWEDVVAKPVFEIQEVALGGGEHNPVNIQKALLQDVPNQPGVKGLKGSPVSGWGSALTTLNEYDVADKISDPDVHHYLHAIEKRQNVAPAYTTDNRQLAQRLDRFGRLAFNAGSGTALTDPGRLSILAEEILRLGVPAELAHLHSIEVVGDAAGGGNAKLKKQRADTAITGLKRLGVKNPLKRIVGTQGVDAVTVRIAPADPSITDTYVTKWSRITAAHEFGHMLGLMDEYYGAKSAEVVKKMISDGMLPSDTRADHLIANPPAQGMSEAPGQTATMKLLDQANLATPNFTLGDGARSTSLMTGGYELWPQHYITVWEALTKLTAGSIDPKHWKLG